MGFKKLQIQTFNCAADPRWSFFCGNGTVFDQEALVCNHPEDAFPCEESPSLYGQIQYGRVDTEEYSEYSEY